MNKDKTGNERYRRWYANHQSQIKQARKELYKTRKATGLCPRCGCKPEAGLTLCDTCLGKARNWQRNGVKGGQS